MLTRRVRLVIFLGVAIVVPAAVIALAIYKSGSPSHTFATIVLGLFGIVGTITAFGDKFLSVGEKQSDKQLRQTLINKVQDIWIDGVLKDALDDAHFHIPVDAKPQQAGQSTKYTDRRIAQSPPTKKIPLVENLIKTIFYRGDADAESIPYTPDTVVKTFHTANEKLLILGAPGSGKSVLLLQLAERLLSDAKDDLRCSVPVMFNLSSWAVERRPLTDWIVDELQRPTYGVSKDLARQWVNTDRLIYLLDGLDEVAEAHRKACVTAINDFITPERQLVVCSRTTEYTELADKLDMHDAIEMQPLSLEDFQAYLEASIPNKDTASRIMTMLQTNTDLWQEVNKPLFLNILITTYDEDKPFSEPHGEGNIIQRVQRLLIEPYIKRQLRNPPESVLLSNEDTRRHLAWLSYQLRCHEQTSFYIEMLQPDWLLRKQSRWLYRLAGGLGVGLFGGLVVGLVLYLFVGVFVGLFFGLGVGLFVGVFGGPDKIDVEKKLKLNGRNLFVGLVVGLLFGLVVGLVTGLVAGLVVGPVVGLVTGVFGGLLFGLVGVLVFGLSVRIEITERSYPGQGLHTTLVVGLFLELVFVLFFGVVGGLGNILVGVLGYDLSPLLAGVMVGTLSAPLFFGLGHVVRHLLLRVFLQKEGAPPWRYDRLLYHAKDRRIMRQVGSSFTFIHRYVLDYFADYYETHYLKTDSHETI